MATVFKRSYTDRKGRSRRTKKWYGQYTDAEGVTQRVPLSTDKSAAQVMLTEILRRVEAERAGMPTVKHPDRTLHQHAQDFLASRASRSCKYREKLEWMFGGDDPYLWRATGITKLTDLTADRVKRWMNQALRDGMARGTINNYVRKLKAFANWMAEEGRIMVSPLRGLPLLNEAVGRVWVRRVLEPQQFFDLLAAARDSDRVKCGLTGPERCLLYSTAACTGFRVSELATLGSQSLRGNSIYLPADDAKNNREATIPIPPALALALSGLTQPIWWVGRGWVKRGAEMLRFDLATAGIPFETAAGRVDFHALRHTYITWLAQTERNWKVVQELARHSSIAITLNRYGHVNRTDLEQAVERLPVSGMILALTPDGCGQQVALSGSDCSQPNAGDDRSLPGKEGDLTEVVPIHQGSPTEHDK